MSPTNALTDEELGKIAYEGFDSYWTEDCAGSEQEAWAASARAVLRAALASSPAVQAVPEGWRLVPLEATSEMVKNGGRGIAFETQGFGGAMRLEHYSSSIVEKENRDRAMAAYRAMLASAPQAPAPEPIQTQDSGHPAERLTPGVRSDGDG